MENRLPGTQVSGFCSHTAYYPSVPGWDSFVAEKSPSSNWQWTERRENKPTKDNWWLLGKDIIYPQVNWKNGNFQFTTLFSSRLTATVQPKYLVQRQQRYKSNTLCLQCHPGTKTLYVKQKKPNNRTSRSRYTSFCPNDVHKRNYYIARLALYKAK